MNPQRGGFCAPWDLFLVKAGPNLAEDEGRQTFAVGRRLRESKTTRKEKTTAEEG